MFSKAHSTSTTKETSHDIDSVNDDCATKITNRRAVTRKVIQRHDSDDDDVSSDSTERPVQRSPTSRQEPLGFRPIDPISQPNQYRERGTAAFDSNVSSVSLSVTQQENIPKQTSRNNQWGKIPSGSVSTNLMNIMKIANKPSQKPPPPTTYNVDYDVQSTYSEDGAKQWYPEGDDDSDPENWG
jgi:hypothetical protein